VPEKLKRRIWSVIFSDPSLMTKFWIGGAWSGFAGVLPLEKSQLVRPARSRSRTMLGRSISTRGRITRPINSGSSFTLMVIDPKSAMSRGGRPSD
jgi:hypothetical protein